jgi:hypothetical protein
MIKTVYDMLSNPLVQWPENAFQIIAEDWTTDPENPVTVEVCANDDVVMYMKKIFCRQGYFFDSDAAGAIETDFLNSWGMFIRMEQDNIDRWYNVLIAEYNPISNYDKTQHDTTKKTGNYTDALQHGETLTITKGGYNTSVSMAPYTGGVQAYTDTSEGHAQGAHDTDARTGTDTRTVTYNTVTDTYDSKISGNIGVTTSQEMIESELRLRTFEIAEEVIKKFIRMYCFTWWGDCA